MDSEPMTEMAPEDPSLGVIYQEVKDAIRAQLDQVDKLDAKVGLLLAAAGVSLAVISSNGVLPPEGKRLTSVFLVAGVIGIVLSLLLGVIALWVRTFDVPPCPRGLRENYLQSPENMTRLSLVDTWVDSYEKNNKKIRWKVHWTKTSAVLLAVGLASTACAFIYNSVEAFR